MGDQETGRPTTLSTVERMTLGLLAATANQAVFVLEISGIPTIVRDVNGLILFDDFNRADQSDLGSPWTTIAGNPAIVSNEYTENASAAVHRAEFISPIPSGSFIFQHGTEALSAMNINARRSTGIVNFINFEVNPVVSSLVQAIISGSGGPSHNANEGTSAPSLFRGVMADTGTSMDVRYYKASVGAITDLTSSLTQIGATIGLSGSNYWLSGDRWRVVFGNNAVGDNFILMAGTTIVVNGLLAGFKARVIGADLTGSLVTESGGTATIDVEGTAFPAEGVEVTDGADVVQISFFSGSGIWAGDSYTYSEI